MTHIEELVLRIPGISEEEGSRLGREVAQKVAYAMPRGNSNMNIPELKIQLNENDLQNKELLATVISDQVIQKIKQASFLLK